MNEFKSITIVVIFKNKRLSFNYSFEQMEHPYQHYSNVCYLEGYYTAQVAHDLKTDYEKLSVVSLTFNKF